MNERDIRRRPSLLPVVAAAAWLIPLTALAHLADPIAHCRAASESDAARIACLEAAISRLMNSGQEKKKQAAVGEADMSRTAVAEEPAPASAATGNASVTAAKELGAEQVAARARPHAFAAGDRHERLTVDIVDIQYTATGRPVFTLDNGQVWRGLQPDPKYQRFTTKRHRTVEIWDSPIGGYRLKVGRLKRVLQVERIK